MRLNFSGCGEDRLREGVRRIGEAIREQVELYGTLTGEVEAVPVEQAQRRRGRRLRARARRVVELRRREDAGPARRRNMSRVAVLKGGRSLERQVSLRSGARVEDALERLGHDVVAIDVGIDLIERLRAEAPDVCFVALHGRDGEDGTVQELLEILGLPYTGSGVPACSRAMDKVLTKHMLVEAGLPTPDFFAFTQMAFRELGAAETLPAIEQRLDFPIVVKPSNQGSALGIKFARSAEDVPAALVSAFSYDARVLLERHVRGRDLRCLRAARWGGPAGAAGCGGGAARRGLLRLRGPVRDRAARSSCAPRTCPRESPNAPPNWRCPRTTCSASTGSGAWT